MLAAVFHGPGEIRLEETPTPEIGPEEVLVKIGANTVCGTDGRILRGEKTKGIYPPIVIGHELAGRIAEVGSEVEGYEVGAPVAMAPVIPCRRCFFCRHDLENVCSDPQVVGYDVNGGLAEYVRVPARAVAAGNLFTARKELPPEHLSLAEPLACCVNGHHRSKVALDETVLIIGAGPIGLFHLQLSLLSGARTVIVSELSAARREMASSLGAHVTADPTSEDLKSVVEEATGGLGADVVTICIGVPQLVNESLRLARTGGRVNIFAGLAGAGWSEVEANLIHYKELTVTGTANSRRADYETALRLIEDGKISVGRMVTHRFPLESATEAIETAESGAGVKVAVMPGADRD